ncbi:MAG: hypothetical protein SAJ12_04945 [Jaaginema sp. PMC 1079.18]|nr:hypothetical protein [Jaaginema sp. PMC 1080.18]MEC4850340.1 hypothetical protein [Jaaginema sp. PMC 1079.18]MEC4865593.1 hypothetical protein [Jaaginema sp. PMC 1078.18]
MAQQLKRWESPRRQGRNDKGRGGAARQRQLKKREKLLRKQLKAQAQKNNKRDRNSGGEVSSSPSFLGILSMCERSRKLKSSIKLGLRESAG